MMETSILHYHVASYIPCSSRARFTTLSYFYHHLRQLHYSRTTISTIISRINPCAYHVTYFSNEDQSCHYFNHCDELVLDSYVSQKNHCCRKFSVQ